ncbi:hypothetical protein GQ53DRAFT_797937 [Thozetella sp. PMI_491]|nr:hypothetical protein GQ53DRAFT_797937 [Thozetella sp. PMI_491]
MKFVADDDATKSILSNWSHPKPVFVASHYFWSAGSTIQKSQEGLLLTLLFEIFRQCPDLLQSSCPKQWLAAPEDLKGCKLGERSDLKCKFCFFIDGLDEYQGDHLEICQALADMSKSAQIKLCVSSRPWNVFRDSFGRVASNLSLHEVTKADIRIYAESRLRGHLRWMIEEIVDRASGVFLWVFLVTSRLRVGLTEYDSFFDLSRRLESCPTELEDFFKDILDKVETFYHDKMASTLRIAIAADKPLDTKNYALRISTDRPGQEQLTRMHENTERRLNARCRGLFGSQQAFRES